MLSQNPAGEAFRDLERLPDMLDAATAAGGAQWFPEAFGKASPRRMSFSSVRSDTAFRSRSLAIGLEPMAPQWLDPSPAP